MTSPHAAGARRRPKFVSRGGDKLHAALERFDVRIAGMRALDAGAATGGFTDCLLAAGARELLSVDVAYGQFAWSLRNDERVRLLERTNVRTLTLEDTGGPVDIVVADLSFISLRAVRDSLLGVCSSGASLVLLVKPQFEAPRNAVPRGGVVRDPATWRAAMQSVVDAYRSVGCLLRDACASPLVGPKGNREFFVWLQAPGEESTDATDAPLDRAIEEAP